MAKKQVAPKAEQDQYTVLLDRVIGQLAEDELALKEQQDLIDNAQSYKREIQTRVRELRRDLATFVKYASPEQVEKIKEMGLDTEDLGQSMNKVAEIAFEIMQEAQNSEMTNGALYEAYVAKFNNPGDAYDYTQFNIKCRSLYNSQRLLRVEVEGKKSRDFIIRINGFQPKTE
jgi:hypothetical protein